MRGIKECLNWMVDNPMKVLRNKKRPNAYNDIRYNKKKHIFEYNTDEHGWREGTCFFVLDQAEWEEVKPKYTFQEAADICRETGKRFKGEYNDMMNRNPEGEVYVWSLDGGDVVIDSEWTEV